MKNLRLLVIGILFGIIMTKSEAISWFRIQEMFHFDSFHMYGIIMSALIVGIISIQIIKRYQIKTFEGQLITFNDKPAGITPYLVGGTLFGIGWSLIGACPGPIYILLGNGYWQMVIVLASTLTGALLYGIVASQSKNP